MKILLIGEYSHLHNSLKSGLQKLGNEVTILGFKDGFKDYPVDYPLEKKWDSGFLKKLKLIVLKITQFDISSYLTYKQFCKNKKKFEDFDVVQLINENSFFCDYTHEKKILKHIFNHNKKVFLLSCGEDYTYVKYNFTNRKNKSAIQPYFKGKIAKKNFSNVLKFRTNSFKKLHYYIYKNIEGVIASDLDYHIPLKKNPKYLGMIPNPIILENFTVKLLPTNDKIIIYHGINKSNFYKKGNDYFKRALAIIQDKYPHKVSIITTKNVPYKYYINSYDKAHILLDQVFAIDQGYNALEAMAKGKVVFTGAEIEFENYYKLSEKVAINALPDVNYLVEQLSLLIENPSEISAIGKRAVKFIEKEHNSIKIAQRYISLWSK